VCEHGQGVGGNAERLETDDEASILVLPQKERRNLLLGPPGRGRGGGVAALGGEGSGVDRQGRLGGAANFGRGGGMGGGRSEFGERVGLGGGSFLLLFFAFLGQSETAGAGVVAGKGVGDGVLQAQLGGAVVDHGEPGDALSEEEVGIDRTQGSQETEESSEGVHDWRLGRGRLLVKQREGTRVSRHED